jgi:regulation of enolase protein 1 (concanavalin A-like superfamily)
MIKKSAFYFIVILFSVMTVPVLSGQQNQKSNASPLKIKPMPLAGFEHRDIGNPSVAGIVNIAKDGIDITAGGADIWGVKDEFNFAYIERTGDFDMVSRIESLAAAHLYTKAGIMAREDLTAGCRHIYFQVFSDNNPRNKNNGGYEFQYRTVKDSSMKAIYPKSSTSAPEFPVTYPNTWIRLQRTKNDFTGYYSTDGKAWKVYTTFTLALPAKIYLGLAVTSHNTSHSATAKFRNIAEIKH